MWSRHKYLILLILVSLIPLLDFFKPGLPITHDGQDHVARIANFYQSLSEGNIVPRWAANLNWGYGHPILMFLYPLASYLASIFHFFGFSLVSSVKIVFASSLVFSGLFMYFWLKEVWDEKAGFVAGLVYMLAPYRFVDLYVRGALGECLAFVWPPLICWLILKLSQKRQWRYLAGSSLAIAALILSHNALSLLFLPIIFVYMGYLIYSSKNKSLNTKYFISVIILAFGLAAFFWLPALFEGKYTLRDIVTKDNMSGFESFSRLLWSEWNYGITGQFSVQVGILQWLSVILAPFLIWRLKKKKNKLWVFLLFLFIAFWVAILMVLPEAQIIYSRFSLIEKFQFAWRFLSLAILPPAILAGGLTFILSEKKKKIAIVFFLLASLWLNQNYWQAKDFLHKEQDFYVNPYPSSTDTGESAPRWSVRFMEKFPETKIAVIDGQADIQEIARETNQHEYYVNIIQSARLVENTLYFPGWQVLVDGQPTEIQFQDPAYRGLMTFNIPEGEHRIIIRFGETRLRFFADLISLGAILFVVLGGKGYNWLNKSYVKTRKIK